MRQAALTVVSLALCAASLTGCSASAPQADIGPASASAPAGTSDSASAPQAAQDPAEQDPPPQGRGAYDTIGTDVVYLTESERESGDGRRLTCVADGPGGMRLLVCTRDGGTWTLEALRQDDAGGTVVMGTGFSPAASASGVPDGDMDPVASALAGNGDGRGAAFDAAWALATGNQEGAP